MPNSPDLKIKRVVAHPEIPPKEFNTVFLNSVGERVSIELAHSSVADIAAALAEGRDEVSAYVNTQLQCSPQQLLNAVAAN